MASVAARDARVVRRAVARPARAAMESLYQLPFERFERYAPSGTADDIAAFVRPYVDAGARHVNLAPVAATPEAVIDTAAEVAERLRSS